MPCERKHIEAVAHAVSASANRECLVDCCCPICCATGNVTSAVLEALAACDESPWRSMESAPKASGPLWAYTWNDTGLPIVGWVVCQKEEGASPYRLIPGHGKVVPVELVEAIAKACEDCYRESCAYTDTYLHGMDKLDTAIRAALDGAL
jgi:hypothetical protein